MTAISLTLPDELLREINLEAAAQRVGKSAVIRDYIERALRGKKKQPVSCLDLMGDAVGSVNGPRDLSSNRQHLAQAVNAHANRRRKNSR